MRHRIAAASGIFAALLSGSDGLACVAAAPFEPADVQYAETVVIGRVENYRIIRDAAARERWRTMAAKMRSQPDISPGFQKLLEEEPKGFLTDYARFDIVVADVLVGSAPARLSVTWNNSTFSEPNTLPSEAMLIALRDARSAIPPVRKTSAYIPPEPKFDLPTILQAPCAGAFLFEATSSRAMAVRDAIAARTQGDR